jgi:hypothetical protein
VEEPFSNELTDGCIIDLCGVIIMFQKPKTMAKDLKIDPQKFINSLNEMKAQCPVLLHEIKFAYVNKKKRAVNAFKRLENSGTGFIPWGGVHIPTSDYSAIKEEHRSYIFPACGI